MIYCQKDSTSDRFSCLSSTVKKQNKIIKQNVQNTNCLSYCFKPLKVAKVNHGDMAAKMNDGCHGDMIAMVTQLPRIYHLHSLVLNFYIHQHVLVHVIHNRWHNCYDLYFANWAGKTHRSTLPCQVDYLGCWGRLLSFSHWTCWPTHQGQVSNRHLIVSFFQSLPVRQKHIVEWRFMFCPLSTFHLSC